MIQLLQDQSHKRYNILTGEWMLVSPHRAKRPWQGAEEDDPIFERENYDASCYLCPGNTRANGEVNPNYKDTFVFVNDFAALQQDVQDFNYEDGLLKATSEKGTCKVICFSPDHSKSLADMDVSQIQKVVQVWMKEYQEMGENPAINYVQIFENKGSIMGCSNPHPHGQIWSQRSLPNEILKKDDQQRSYYEQNKRSLLLQYVQEELGHDKRIIYENDSFVILVPFWAVWPFETMIIPKEHQRHIGSMDSKTQSDFSDAISVITRKYDKVFNCSFPYSSGIHQAPTNDEKNEHWHWHMSFYPPLLRSATVKKFMVGYEMFAMPQRDITAESVAQLLRGIEI